MAVPSVWLGLAVSGVVVPRRGRVVHSRGRPSGVLCTEKCVNCALCTRGGVHNAGGRVWAGATVRTFFSITRYLARVE